MIPPRSSSVEVEQDLDEVPDREDGQDGRGAGLEQGQRRRVPRIHGQGSRDERGDRRHEDDQDEIGRIPRPERQAEDRHDDGRDRPADDELRHPVECRSTPR